jgi:16S rRNA (guanine(966)-N(2))-methyltransferase RsmD
MRPTSGKVKAALFNILGSAGRLGANFLDLFAGTGAVALEALRRGAASALCVESDRAAAAAIIGRFTAAGYPKEIAVCLCMDVRRALPRLAGEGKTYGVIFADPPYCMGWGKTLPGLAAANIKLLTPGGVFVFERSSREEPAGIFAARDDRIYGETVLSFYWNREGAEI